MGGEATSADPQPPQAEAAARARPGRPLLLGSIASGTILNPLNSSLIAVALVDLAHDFGLAFGTASWLISVYYLASSVGLPVMGRLGDLYGRKRMFLWGLVLVALPSAAAPFAPSFGVLLAVRAVQAVGGSALYPSGIGIVRDARLPREARALAVIATASSIAASIGPTLGGALVGFDGWRAIFWVNVPLAVVSFAVAARTLPRDPPRSPRPPVRDVVRALDPLGALAFAAALVSLLWFLLSLPDGPSWPALPLALAAGAAFVVLEARTREPFIDVQALRANRALVAAYGHYALVNVVFYSFFFGVPSFLEDGRGLSAEEAGLVMLTITGLGVVTYPLAARTIERLGVRPALVVGGCFMTAGSLLLLPIDARTSPPAIAGILAVLGVSTAFNNLGLQTAMVAAAPPEAVGTASGLFQTSRYLGTILSASLLGLVFGTRIDVAQLHVLALVLAVLAVLVLVASLASSSFDAARRRA